MRWRRWHFMVGQNCPLSLGQSASPHLAMSWCPAIRRVFPLVFFTSPPSLLLPRRFASSLPKLYLSPHLVLGSCSHVIRSYKSTVQSSDLESKVNRIVEGLLSETRIRESVKKKSPCPNKTKNNNQKNPQTNKHPPSQPNRKQQLLSKTSNQLGLWNVRAGFLIGSQIPLSQLKKNQQQQQKTRLQHRMYN